MKRLREWFHRTFVAPTVDTVRREFQQNRIDMEKTLSRLSEENAALVRATMQDDAKADLTERRAEWSEAIGMYGSGPWKPTGVTVGESGQLVAQESANMPAVLKEVGMWELELALEDRGWQRQLAQSNIEFSRYGMQQIMLMCRLYFIKNTLVRRAIEVCADYVLGRGLEISCEVPAANEVLQKFLEANKKQLGQSALAQKHKTLHTDGNLFWCFFNDLKTGEMLVQTIDATEVEDIICNPDNSDEEWLIKRRWPQMKFDAGTGISQPVMQVRWYLAYGYIGPFEKMDAINDELIAKSDDEQPIRVYHRKVGGLEKWKFGCPVAYPWLDWARAIRHYIEDWCTMQRAFARFSWDVETKGGAPAIANFKQALATTLANGGTWWEQNPTPNVASAFVSGPGTKLTPIKTPQNNPEACRRVVLMFVAGTGLPETFFGDATAGSLATAKSLDRPTELKFLGWQELWSEDIGIICMEALNRSLRAPKGKLRESFVEAGMDAGDVVIEMHRPAGSSVRVIRCKESAAKDPKKKITVKVTFPAVLEHDIAEQVGALVEAATLNGFEPNGMDLRVTIGLLLREFGVENPEDVVEAMFPEAEYDAVIDRVPTLKAQQEQAINPPLPPTGAPGGKPPSGKKAKPAANQESLSRAILALKAAASKMQKVNGHANV